MASAPRHSLERTADKAKSFAAGAGAAALDAQPNPFPNFGPQLVEAHNANAAANQSAVVTLEDNSTFTVVLAPGETRFIGVPVKALTGSSGADVSFNCYWWIGAGPNDFSYFPTINP